MNEYTVLALIGIYLLAGLVKGTVGVGFPTAAIAMTATLFDARTAIAFVVIPMTLLNAWQVYRSGHVVDVLTGKWRLIVFMVVSIVLASLVAAEVPIRWLTLFLGVVTTCFAIVSLLKTIPELPDRYDTSAQVIVGVISGIFGGIAGIWAPPIVMYLTSRRVTPEKFVQIVGVVLFIGSSFLLMGYTYTGIINSSNATISFALLVPAIIGFSVGERLRKKISSDLFYKIILSLFLVLGLNFIRRAVFL